MTATAATPKLLGIEAARGVAACMVVLYHAARHVKADMGFLPFGGITQFGHAGVDFFFVLSGFIIYFVHGADGGQSTRWAHYAERRFTRIYPLYWVVLAITLLMVWASPAKSTPELGFFLQSLTLLPHSGDPIVGVSWTLQHEMLFYLTFAVFILSLRWGVAVFVIWFFWILVHWFERVDFDGPVWLVRAASPFNMEFFFGMFAAYSVRKKWVSSPHLLFAMGLTFFFSFAIAENLGLVDGYASVARLSYGLSAMLVVMGIAGGATDQLQAKSLWVKLGSASYAIYLFHLIAIGVVYKGMTLIGLHKTLAPWGIFLTLSGAGILGSMLLSRWVEYPLMNLIRRAVSGFSKVKVRMV